MINGIMPIWLLSGSIGFIIGLLIMLWQNNRLTVANTTWDKAYKELLCKLKHYEEVFKLMGKENNIINE